ncbi:MAG TPA: tetratricopeptide repeat protein [Gemmataceae bacterium]|nr:tetratricopeptide repeat protein [Gemmataceae bacterium]
MTDRQDESGARPRGKGRGLVALSVLGLALLVGLGVVVARRAPWRDPAGPERQPDATGEQDPRRAYAGPYRNVNPDVRYVGDAQCVGCHEEIAKSYAGHPMGRSLAPAADLIGRQRYSPDSNNPFDALGRRFRADPQGQRLWHRQAVHDEAGKPVAELSQEVRWVIGSGTKGYSYLSERDGYLFQTPISWFSQKQRWDLSPGFGPSVLAAREVPASCLFCHADRLREHPEHPDRFLPPVFEGHSIGCERCHGPGELHARGDMDHAIVNPARLPPALRDAVCEQCHLEGEARVQRAGRGLFDYRPGLPLHEFRAVLVQGRQGGEDAKAVNHVEQMYQSKCFQRPVGDLKLGCVTCHDPHVHIGPDKRVTHYRKACLKCHDGGAGRHGCSVAEAERRRANAADSCVDCHMPRYGAADIPHTASTDHRIVRRPERRPVHAADLDRAAFADFYRDRFPRGDPQAERNLGMGLVKMMHAGLLQPQRHGGRAVLLLESALGQFPQDAELRASKAQALALLGRPADALPDARAALAKRPGDWRLLALAADGAQAEGQTEAALAYWREAVRINPGLPEYQASLVALLLRAGQLDEARTRCQRLLEIDPFNLSGLQAWVGFLLREGKKAEAERAFAVLRRLRPPDLEKREEWFRTLKMTR